MQHGQRRDSDGPTPHRGSRHCGVSVSPDILTALLEIMEDLWCDTVHCQGEMEGYVFTFSRLGLDKAYMTQQEVEDYI